MKKQTTKKPKVILKPSKNGRGRPSLESMNKTDEKKEPNGLTVEQTKWLQDEAQLSGTSFAAKLRQAVAWFITSTEKARSGTEVGAMFDPSFEKGGE